MKNLNPQSVIELQPHDRLAPVLSDLDEIATPILIDISRVKQFGLEDFQALRNCRHKELVSLRCGDQRLRSLLCRLRLHKLYQVWGTAA
jgi:hypothetical protein